jgi:osmotically-inducible protein OsmY
MAQDRDREGRGRRRDFNDDEMRFGSSDRLERRHGRDHGQSDDAGGWGGRSGHDEDERGGWLFDEQRRSGRSHGEGSWTGSSPSHEERGRERGGYERDRGYGRSSSYGGSQSGYGQEDYSQGHSQRGGMFRQQGGYAPQQGGYGGFRDEVFGARPERAYEGSREHRGGYGGGHDERGFFEKASDEVSSWFGDDDAERRRRQDQHRGRGPKGYSRSDERIREDVNDRLTDDTWLDASDIEVTVAGREVTLSGEVASRDDKRRAEDIAERVSGVAHVQNNLRVKGRPGVAPMGGGSTGERASAHAGTAVSSLSQTGSGGSTDNRK